MATVDIDVQSGSITLNPNPVKLGGKDSHDLDWKNKYTGGQAIVVIDPKTFGEIFTEPLSRSKTAIGGGSKGPIPPLTLKPKDQRSDGDFNYFIQIDGFETITGTMKINK